MTLNGKELKQFVKVLSELVKYGDDMWDDVYEWSGIDYSERFQVSDNVGTALYETVQSLVFGGEHERT